MRTPRGLRAVLFLLAAGAPLSAQTPVPSGSAAPPSAPVSTAADGSAPKAADEGSSKAAEKSLLGIAEREAQRSMNALNDRILADLRRWTLTHDLAPDRGQGLIQEVVALGPDAAPVLLSIIQSASAGKGEAGVVQPAARALVALAERMQRPGLLRQLTDAVKGASAAVRLDVLVALATVDNEAAVAFATPQLADDNANVRAQAVRVLGRQKSHAAEVAKLLRPLYAQEGASKVEVLRALLALEDRASVDLAQSALTATKEPALVSVALAFVGAYGAKPALAPLATMLDPTKSSPFEDVVLKQAVDAVQRIGLREIDAKRPAEDLLVNCMSKHPSESVRSRATWQLGPFQNELALKKLEEPILRDIANSKSSPGRSNTNNYIYLAEDRLRFEAWSKADEALKKAKDEDEKGFSTSRIDRLRAVAQCGLEKYEPAKKLMAAMTADERMELLDDYPILEKMRSQTRYRDLFSGK